MEWYLFARYRFVVDVHRAAANCATDCNPSVRMFTLYFAFFFMPSLQLNNKAESRGTHPTT